MRYIAPCGKIKLQATVEVRSIFIIEHHFPWKHGTCQVGTSSIDPVISPQQFVKTQGFRGISRNNFSPPEQHRKYLNQAMLKDAAQLKFHETFEGPIWLTSNSGCYLIHYRRRIRCSHKAGVWKRSKSKLRNWDSYEVYTNAPEWLYSEFMIAKDVQVISLTPIGSRNIFASNQQTILLPSLPGYLLRMIT